MVSADYIAIAAVLIFAIIGSMIGFGKQLQILTKGIFGIVISLVVCYLLFGFVYNIPFVQTLLEKFKDYLISTDKPVVNFLLKIRIDIIAYAVALFIVVTIVRIVIVSIVKNVVEAESTVMRFVNKVLGAILGVGIAALIGLVVMQIKFISGDGVVPEKLVGSFFRLDYVYAHNPLTAILNLWKLS